MSKAYQEAVLRGKERTFGQFIWDGEKQAFCGRTLTSWLKIIVFYNIYYGFLAAFFSILMILFYTTLDPHMPKYTPGDYSSLLRNPSLDIRPRPTIWDYDQDVISYNPDIWDHHHWSSQISNFVHRTYENTKNLGADIKQCTEDNPALYETGEVCLFTQKSLGEKCNEANEWGYRTRNPCFILKLNKMFGWQPVVFEELWEISDYMPDDLREHIEQAAANNSGIIPKMVWVSCTQTLADGEIIDNLGEIKYTPWRGFPSYYFPYMNIPGYMQPIVAIEFTGLPVNRRIDVECKAWAKNMVHARKESLGLVKFSLFIEQDNSK